MIRLYVPVWGIVMLIGSAAFAAEVMRQGHFFGTKSGDVRCVSTPRALLCFAQVDVEHWTVTVDRSVENGPVFQLARSRESDHR